MTAGIIRALRERAGRFEEVGPVIVTAGCLGLGAVWGWLLAMIGPNTPRCSMTAIAVVAATGLLTLEVLLLVSVAEALALLVGVLVGLILHLAVRKELRRPNRSAAQLGE
jgi:hypothetical protein